MWAGWLRQSPPPTRLVQADLRNELMPGEELLGKAQRELAPLHGAERGRLRDLERPAR